MQFCETDTQKILSSIAEKEHEMVLKLDITADTFQVLPLSGGEGGEQPEYCLSERFSQFVEGPLCHDNDRQRLRQLASPEALKAAIAQADGKPVSLVFRRKYQPDDRLFSTVSMKLVPSQTDDGHLTATVLLRSVTEEIQQYNASLEEDSRLSGNTAGKKTLLVVEDNEMNREILTEILSDSYQVLQAENGAVGLNLLQKHMMDISVVILDVQMPVMNGYEFLKYSQADSFLSKIPVIVATGSNNAEEERICLGLGASDFVAKPYNPDIIKSRIANIIRLKESVATMAVLQTEERTGLYTLQAFTYHAGLAFEKQPDSVFSVIALDVEHFNNLAENYGDKEADHTLRQVAQAIRESAAPGDIFGHIGAGRFLILRENACCEATQACVQNLLTTLQTACSIKGIAFKAGIYHNVDKSLTVSAMCDRAVAALNSVGHHFEKRYALYDEKHAERARRMAVMEADMRDAYDKGQFSVYYQPKHDALTGKLLGAEALIRWIHPTFGFMSPGEFIPLFERNGFITYADYYVLKRTCRNMRAWLDEGITPVPVSVNASRRDFDWDDFLGRVQKPLAENRIDPSLIHIEVTESMFSDRMEEIGRILASCREAGFEIELDDFGSGYSSLTTLASLPLDVMKLDMSFMKNYQDEKKRKVLAMCINLAKNLGLRTVSEGVETADQLQLLQQYGCDLIQGYYFSKPLPEKDFRQYLIDHADAGRVNHGV